MSRSRVLPALQNPTLCQWLRGLMALFRNASLLPHEEGLDQVLKHIDLALEGSRCSRQRDGQSHTEVVINSA
eukprot:1155997-Pelagomonas_calceolata.AAC.2